MENVIKENLLQLYGNEHEIYVKGTGDTNCTLEDFAKSMEIVNDFNYEEETELD
jgi:hypothetical protein